MSFSVSDAIIRSSDGKVDAFFGLQPLALLSGAGISSMTVSAAVPTTRAPTLPSLIQMRFPGFNLSMTSGSAIVIAGKQRVGLRHIAYEEERVAPVEALAPACVGLDDPAFRAAKIHEHRAVAPGGLGRRPHIGDHRAPMSPHRHGRN